MFVLLVSQCIAPQQNIEHCVWYKLTLAQTVEHNLVLCLDDIARLTQWRSGSEEYIIFTGGAYPADQLHTADLTVRLLPAGTSFATSYPPSPGLACSFSSYCNGSCLAHSPGCPAHEARSQRQVCCLALNPSHWLSWSPWV